MRSPAHQRTRRACMFLNEVDDCPIMARYAARKVQQAVLGCR
jgi:hypothetical protein